MQTMNMVDCPRCGGHVDFDEDGRPYTCFTCGDTGYIEASRLEPDEAAQYQTEQILSAQSDALHGGMQ